MFHDSMNEKWNMNGLNVFLYMPLWIDSGRKTKTCFTPPKTNMASWKIHHQWRCISYIFLLKVGIVQPLSFQGCTLISYRILDIHPRWLRPVLSAPPGKHRHHTARWGNPTNRGRTCEPRKKPSYFPWNTGWLIDLIGILIMVYYNPYITG